MTHKENIMAILECYFTGFKKELIDSACERILEQESSEDCISRQAVLEILKKNKYHFNLSEEGYCEGLVLWSENLIKDDARKEIEQLPTITPKGKTGHWVDSKDWKERSYDSMYFRKHCSLCNGTGKIQDKFCPNCGAKMVSDTDG